MGRPRLKSNFQPVSQDRRRDDGTWWINEKGDFCVHFVFFAGGNPVCRRMVEESSGIVAYTWDRQPDGWAFKK
jgi:hypothetical protein